MSESNLTEILESEPLRSIVDKLKRMDTDEEREHWWHLDKQPTVDALVKLYNLNMGLGKVYTDRIIDDIAGCFRKKKTQKAQHLKKLIKEFATEDLRNRAKSDYMDDDFSYDGLDFGPKGDIRPTYSNLVYLLQHFKDLNLGYDAFTQTPYFLEKPWTDGMDLDRIDIALPDGNVRSYWRATSFHLGGLKTLLNKSFFTATELFLNLKPAIDEVAKYNTFDIYHDWMNALPVHTAFDATHDGWLAKYLHSEDDPEYLLLAERILTTSIIARCYQPGFDCRFVVVLEGPQDIGKTRFARMLCFNDQFFDELDFSREYRTHINRQIVGMAILELSEGGGVTNADQNFVKRTISALKDRVRELFTSDYFNYERRCVMVMTTNHESDYLTDRTGNSRFLPVSCGDGKIDVEGLRAHWPQILAQAKFRFYQNQASPWVADGQEQAIQEDALQYRERNSKEYNWIVKEILPHYEVELTDTGMTKQRIIDILSVGPDSMANRNINSSAVTDALRKLGYINKVFRERNNGFVTLPRGRYWVKK